MSRDIMSYAKLVGYNPFPEQLDFHRSTARFRVPVCGRRFGKSTMGGRDMGNRMFDKGKWFWIVGPTYDLAEKEFRVIWNDLIIKMKFGRDKRVRKAYNKKQGDMFIELPWGTRVECRSAKHKDTLVGEGLDGVIMAEAAKQDEESWKRYVRPALADHRGWATFPTTPEGYNWIHRMWQYGNNTKAPNYRSWSFPSWVNTEVFPGGFENEEIQDLLRTTSKEWFDQEIGAKFSSFVGKIYGEFDETYHVGNVEFNPLLPNYITFDWGFTNPLAAVEFQVTPSDQVRVWRLHYKSFMTVYEHCMAMKNRRQPDGYHINCCFGDAADPEAAADVSRWLAPCVTDPAAKANWRDGIELVKSFLAPRVIGEDEYGTPIEEPGFVMDFSCEEGITEFNNYKSPKPIQGRNVPEFGNKMQDHFLDALRYGLMHVFKLGGNYHLADVVEQYAVSPERWETPITVTPGYSDGWTRGESGIFTMDGRF